MTLTDSQSVIWVYLVYQNLQISYFEHIRNTVRIVEIYLFMNVYVTVGKIIHRIIAF